MGAWTPVVFDFSDFSPALHGLVLDSLRKTAAEKRYASRSTSHAWRNEVKEAAHQHSGWEDMVSRAQFIVSYDSMGAFNKIRLNA